MTRSLLEVPSGETPLAFPKPTSELREERKRLDQESKSERSKLEHEAERLVKAMVRQRDGLRCRFCSSRAYEVAHGFGEKAHPSARWVAENLATTCRRCHMEGHAHPTRWLRAFEILIGADVFERVKRIAQKPGSGPSAEDVISRARAGLFWELPG